MAFSTNFTFTGTNLPSNQDYASQILAMPSLLDWFQADSSAVTLGTGTSIAAFVGKKASGRSFTQGTASKQALLTANQISGFSAAIFDGALSQYGLTGTEFDLTSAFSVAMIFQASAVPAGTQQLYAKFGTNGCTLSVGTNNTISFSNGGGISSVGYVRGTAGAVIASYNPTTQVVKTRCNGVNGTVVAATSVESGGTSALGGLYPATATQLLTGFISDAFFFNEDLLADGTGLDLVERFAVGTYPAALTFTPY